MAELYGEPESGEEEEEEEELVAEPEAAAKVETALVPRALGGLPVMEVGVERAVGRHAARVRLALLRHPLVQGRLE
jgi:hypothetical protein